MLKRKLMMAERMMYVDAATPVNAVFTARIKGSFSEDDFKIALIKIQQKHPLLRTSVDHSEAEQPVFILQKDMAPIPLRIVHRQTDMDWLLESEKEWYRLFEEAKQPLAQVVWIQGHEVSEILWVLPHCIADGTTIVTLMRELLCLLDNPLLPLGPCQDYHSTKEFFPAGYNTKSQAGKAWLFLQLAKLFFLFKRSGKKRDAGGNYAIHWKLDPKTTGCITEKCKNEGISVHALICSAFMQAFQQIQGKTAKGKVISPVDIRHFLPEIKEDHLFAFAPTVALSWKAGSLLENAKRIKQELLRKIKKMNVRKLLWIGEQMHPVVRKMIALLLSSSGNHDVTLSNMGRINMPADFKRFELKTLFSPTVAFPWFNANTLVITTYKQQMDFMFMSHPHFLAKDAATAIKDKAMQLLTSL